MITIGIEGKPGSGKSTLARSLAEYPGVAHIEVDRIVENVGLVKLRNIILGCANVLVKGALSRKGRYTKRLKNQEDNIYNKISIHNDGNLEDLKKKGKLLLDEIIKSLSKKGINLCEEPPKTAEMER